MAGESGRLPPGHQDDRRLRLVSGEPTTSDEQAETERTPLAVVLHAVLTPLTR
jgi:hypothetical protein